MKEVDEEVTTAAEEELTTAADIASIDDVIQSYRDQCAELKTVKMQLVECNQELKDAKEAVLHIVAKNEDATTIITDVGHTRFWIEHKTSTHRKTLNEPNVREGLMACDEADLLRISRTTSAELQEKWIDTFLHGPSFVSESSAIRIQMRNKADLSKKMATQSDKKRVTAHGPLRHALARYGEALIAAQTVRVESKRMRDQLEAWKARYEDVFVAILDGTEQPILKVDEEEVDEKMEEPEEETKETDDMYEDDDPEYAAEYDMVPTVKPMPTATSVSAAKPMPTVKPEVPVSKVAAVVPSSNAVPSVLSDDMDDMNITPRTPVVPLQKDVSVTFCKDATQPKVQVARRTRKVHKRLTLDVARTVLQKGMVSAVHDHGDALSKPIVVECVAASVRAWLAEHETSERHVNIKVLSKRAAK